MNKGLRLAIAFLSLTGVAGCGHSANGLSNVDPVQAVVSNVVQSGSGDSWERFLLGNRVDPESIAAGPDGNMWFTASGTDAIARITTAGVMTSYPLNDPSPASPFDITTGPDKALWFTDSGPYIGRMTTGGALTRYPLLQSASPQLITSGPDGNLWFTADGTDGAGYIGRITTNGAITVYTIATKNVNVYGITAGPDGNVWFADAGTDRIAGSIGRITSSGSITVFPANPNGPRPRFIVLAGDHQLYYQDRSFHRALVRVDAATGATTLVGHLKVLPSNVVPVGPDSLWYLSDCHCPRPSVYRFSLRTGSNQLEDVSPYDAVFGYTALGPDENLWIASSLDGSIDVAVRQ